MSSFSVPAALIRLRTWLPLIAALLAAAVLRLVHFTDRGLVYWDEAKFALEGERMLASLQVLVGMHASLASGKAVGTAKPTHALLIGLSYAVLGVHDYAPLALNAACSILGVMVLYFIGRTLFDPVTAAIAALLLAASEYDVIYARSALSESDATLFLLAAIALWLRGFNRTGPPAAANAIRTGSERSEAGPVIWTAPVLVPAVLLGLAFTTNYRAIVYAATLIGLDLAIRLTKLGWRALPRGAALWLAGCVVAPVLWQIVDLIAHANGLVLFSNELTAAWTPYLKGAWYQLHEGKQSVIRFQPVPYFDWFVLRQGWPVAVLSAAGLALAFVRRRLEWVIPAALAGIPWLLFVFAPFFVPRNLVPALPFTSLLSAAAIAQGVERLDQLRGVRWSSRALSSAILFAVAVALFALGFWMSWRLTAVRSGFAQAASYLESRGGRPVTTTEIMVFYFPGSTRCEAPALPVSISQLPAYVHAGYKYAVVERHHGSSVADFIQTHGRLAARFPALGDISIGENLIASENSKTPQQDSRPETVSVYWLGGLRISASGRPIPCDRERVT